MLFSSVLSKELLEKAAAASSMALQSQIGKMLDSITCTTVPCDIHQWYSNKFSSVEHGSKQPWAADIKVPNATSNYDDFISIGMKKSIPTGMHGHGFCCEKGEKGKYMWRLVFKQGLHTWSTFPFWLYLSDRKTLQKNYMQMYQLTLWMKIPLPCWMPQIMPRCILLWKQHHNYQYCWLCK
jgi:hypothetical protein